MDCIKSEDELLQSIIDLDGDCVSSSLCSVCPFAVKCIDRAIKEARLLPKQDRIRMAYERLFNKLLEKELE